MAFPQKNNPQIIHLFIDDILSVVDEGYPTNFFNFYSGLCVNFISINNLGSHLFDEFSKEVVSNFIQESYDNSICDISCGVNLFDPATNGLNDINLLLNYNIEYSGTSKINWVTVRNDFWKLSTLSSVTYNNCANININSDVVTLTNGINTTNLYILPGNIINVGGYYRQIKQINNLSTLTVDRPFPINLNNSNLIVYNSSISKTIDFDTYIYRLKLLKNLINTQGIKVEIYASRLASLS